MICTFFGHRDCPEAVKPVLKGEIKRLITIQGVYKFYVGNTGAFDNLVYHCLKEIKKEYQYIQYFVVLEKPPIKESMYDSDETLLPLGFEDFPPRFAIDRRNRWMIEQAEYVITYITHSFGGAAKFADIAVKKKKKVINIADITK